MQSQRIGSVRVSTVDQHPERHLHNVQVDRVETDTASGKETTRAELVALLTFVREGDTVVVHRMDRLARNLDDLRRLVQHLTQRGGHWFRFVQLSFRSACLCRFLHQEELMEREAMVQNPSSHCRDSTGRKGHADEILYNPVDI